MDDPIGHSHALGGFLAGAAVGLAAAAGIAIATGAIVGAVATSAVTAGLAAPLAIGIAATATELVVNVVAGGYAVEKAQEIGESLGGGMTLPTGTVAEGSSNVYINGRRAAFVTKKVLCSKPGHQPGDMIAEGASAVFINGQPAARVGDKVVCGGVIISGSSNVFIGSPTKSVLKVNPEVPGWARTAVFVASLVPAGASLLRAVRPALKALSEKGLVGSLKAGVKSLEKTKEGYKISKLDREKINNGEPLYRGDTRDVNFIHENGFKSRGGTVSLEDYVENNTSSIFISTSKSKYVSEKFANQGMDGGYVHVIEPEGLRGVDVNAVYKGNTFFDEQEVSVINQIPKENIIGSYRVNPNGSIGSMIFNPNYKGGIE
ncbi:PAAR domain-containing protein [Acetobacter sp.]|uniref:PAAR domain-containing protein n=1 Tax=Acetobacter sp. TaxID=440 RepID=UPI0025C1B2C8|nr:PAAR domain-containing protein [Acetobacter sp.]MCH4091008.1 PAAR domain-containing protein [Acetobacter sp.]MCI1300191.1 PAAR domain-containing protein [Acetobacter sp.]MCI1316141.1 PAAR domain-containing protein [Acetobacter sp.]